MFCPQCGQQQVPGSVRFCSRCGFPLDGVMTLLGNSGMLPIYRTPEEGPPQISPRRRGVRQGAALLLSGAILVPILGVFWSYNPWSNFLGILIALTSIICFVGGPLRMLFAAVFEEGAPKPVPIGRPFVGAPVAAPQFASHAQPNALPHPSVPPTPAWRPRPITAELNGPPSVTENTTRLLDKEERKER